MTDVEWTRVEGMVIGSDLDPMKLAQALVDRSVVAELEWYEKTPQLVGIRVASDGDKVATLAKRGRVFHPGPALEELVGELANDLKVEVMIGGVTVDATPEGGPDDASHDSEPEERIPTRIVEIGNTPASAVPLMAAFEGVDIAELDLPDEKRLLVSVVPSHRGGWYFGDVPVVTLTMDGDEFQAFLVPEDDPESVITYNWGMKELIVAGAQGWEKVPDSVQNLVGARPEIQAIHDAVPGIDADAAFEATQVRGAAAVRKLVAALGLPSDVADFLLGTRSIEQISGATVHRARGISNAIGRSVDILIDERQEGSRFWDGYTDLVTSKSWLIPAVTALEAAGGLALLVLGRKRNGSRSTAGKIGTAIGSVLMLDSVAQNALAKYMGLKATRREEDQETDQP
ncbi:hypothetical protein U6G28_01160 [Actinomycetaceae bacterium MB13-C1-2]|nr:hypothetical protein U6G28_01160 [Actinomycetaceae bacterium MB13-C1-2]